MNSSSRDCFAFQKEIEDLGENSVPRFIETRNCNKTQQPTCRPPYICKESLYSVSLCNIFFHLHVFIH